MNHGTKGIDVLPDTSHATQALVEHIRGYYQAKTDKNLDWQMSFFSRKQFTCIDGIPGWHWYTWQAMREALAGWYPTWPKDSASYPTRILGDTTSAILIFTDTPGMFGPGQVRNYGAVNFGPDGEIERWVDYWDARQFGVATWEKEEEPPGQWPTDFRESTVGETASPLMRRTDGDDGQPPPARQPAKLRQRHRRPARRPAARPQRDRPRHPGRRRRPRPV